MTNPINRLVLQSIISYCELMKLHIKSVMDITGQFRDIDFDFKFDNPRSKLYSLDEESFRTTLNTQKKIMDHDMEIMKMLMDQMSADSTNLIHGNFSTPNMPSFIPTSSNPNDTYCDNKSKEDQMVDADNDTDVDTSMVSSACDARTGRMWAEILDMVQKASNSNYGWKFHSVLFNVFQSVNVYSLEHQIGIEQLLAECDINLTELHESIVHQCNLRNNPDDTLSAAQMIRLICHVGETITITPDSESTR